MDQEKKIIMGKNAKIIIFSLIGLAVLGGVAAVLMLTAPADKPQDSGHIDFPAAHRDIASNVEKNTSESFSNTFDFKSYS